MERLSTLFNKNALLGWIQKNPEQVVQLQKSLTNVTCMLLEESLKSFRRGQGIVTPKDELEQNTQLVRAIQYICENNFLFFLQLIKRFDLIRELFHDKELFAKEQSLVDELERYSAHQERQQAWLIQQQNEKSIEQAKSKPPLKSSESANPMAMCLYYEAQLLTINVAFHERQIKSHNKAATGYMDNFQETVALLEKHGKISPLEKKRLDLMVQNYQEEYQHIQDMPTQKPDGSPDVQALARKDIALEKFANKLNTECKNIHDLYKDTPELDGLRQKRQDIEHIHTQEKHHNIKQREQEITKITPHLEFSREKAKDEMAQQMDSIIGIIERGDISKLSESEAKQLKNAHQQLGDTRNLLENSTTGEEYKRACATFCDTINDIENLIKPPSFTITDHQEFHKTKEALTELNSFTITQEVSFQNIEVAIPHNPIASEENGAPLEEAPVIPVSDATPNITESPQNSSLEAVIQNITNPDLTIEDSRKIGQQFRNLVQEVRLESKDDTMKAIYDKITPLLNESHGMEHRDEITYGDGKELLNEIIHQLEELQSYNSIDEVPEDLVFLIDENTTALVDRCPSFIKIKTGINDLTMTIMETKEALSQELSEDNTMEFK